MSETTEAPAPEVEAPAIAPAAETPEPQATETPAAETTETPASDQPAWKDTRLSQLTREKHEERRARELAERRATELEAALTALQEGKPTDTAGLTQAQIRAEATKLAQAELAAREHGLKMAAFEAAGRKDFPDFDQRCNVVAAAGAGERPEFMAIIGEMDDGARVVMHLADNPAEATRIAAMPVHQMALALSKVSRQLEAPAAKPKAVSQAPKPITPLAGTGVTADPDLNDPKLSMAEYTRIREKQEKARREAGR